MLDAGAGTGAVSAAALAAGTRVVAADGAVAMLARRRAHRPPGVAADVRRLPFATGTFDAVLAGFVLNHLDRPHEALLEAHRVTRPGAAVVATTFHAAWDHPAKALVDEVAARYGFRAPAWYRHLKQHSVAVAGDPSALLNAAADVGFDDADVVVRTVDVGMRGCDLAAWRLGMAHLAPFVAGLPAPRRRALEREAAAAVRGAPPLRPRLLVLRARSGGGC